MSTATIYIFSISRHWTRCEVWTGARKTKRRLGTSVLVPDVGLTRSRRREIITQWLRERFGITYNETD